MSSFLTAEISPYQQSQQFNFLQNNQLESNVTTITNHSINDHNFTAIENGTNFDYEQHLSNVKVGVSFGRDLSIS